ncbi:MAG: sigma 54-interacting transcriptional regulator [Myxococcales bacterium]|nr:sigma 54-interacting transcriptional regulator [Myxococcales bacterium]
MPPARLIVIDGPDLGREFDIPARGGGIGRGDDNAAQLTDPAVSRAHCSLEPRDGALCLVDEGSRNKTLVNGQRVAVHRLEAGDEIVVGQTRMTFLPADGVAVTRPASAARVTMEVGTRELMSLAGAPGEARARRHLAALAGLGERLPGEIGRGREAVARATAEACLAVLGADRGFVIAREPRDGRAAPIATAVAAGDPAGGSLALPRDVFDKVLGHGKAIAVEAAAAGGPRAALAVPLAAGDEVALLWAERRGATPWDSLDVMAAACLAQLAGAALAAADTQGTLTRGQAALQATLDERLGDGELIGRSPAALALFDLVARVAPTDATVLLGGESGSGKEMVARALHRASRRAQGPCVAVNCAALTETLIESELFGHEKGAFTGATEKKLGRFEAADKGTLFLDEIGEMPLALQTKLLRVLEERRFERVGGTRPVTVDVRLVAATNRDLSDMVRRGLFREDLFYRLSVVHTVVPPLRERADDIPLLAEHFLARMRAQVGRRVVGFRPEAMRALRAHPWPGNVRELRNAIERAVVLGRGEWIEEGDLPPSLGPRAAPARRASTPTPPLGSMALGAATSAAAAPPVAPSSPAPELVIAAGPSAPPAIAASPPAPDAPAAPAAPPAARSLRELEREGIIAALAATGGNKAQAAAILEIDRSTLYKKLKEYDIG